MRHQVTERLIAFLTLRRHARQHRHGRIDIVVHEHFPLAIVLAVQAAKYRVVVLPNTAGSGYAISCCGWSPCLVFQTVGT